jgi:two-component system nitrogen regulation sensor histidine kinase NtrY
MTLARSDIIGKFGPKWLYDTGRRRRLITSFALCLAVAAPVCAVLTYAMMTGDGPFADENGTALRALLIVDFCLALALIGVIAWRVAMLVLARRARSAGSRLHLRMVRMFTIIAVAPALLLGLFAAVTVTFSLEGWLNKRVAGVVQNSVSIAESYVRERHQAIQLDASAIASEVVRATPFGVPNKATLDRVLARVSQERRLVEVYILNSSGEIIARGPNSYLFLFTPPTEREFAATRPGEVYVFEDRSGGAVRALQPLPGVFDSFLYLVRPVDGEALRVLAETRSMVSEYQQLENQRSDMQLIFAFLYIGFAVLILSAAIWFGIWFADRLARPIGRLAGAADRVAKGDLDARVNEEKGDDEIAVLSRAFNRMTEQVQRQRESLLDVNVQLDQRRRFTEAVLSGVTAGVLRLDKSGVVNLANGSAEALLGTEGGALDGMILTEAYPAVAPIIENASDSPDHIAEGRAVIGHQSGDSEFLVRVACQVSDGMIEGYVVTLDDMTDLVSAQRLAAWGDVAQRVAHEIRNPLTPIQLSAERLHRKFGKQIDADRQVFDQCTGTIVRQVEQIRRMVEEFSNFARMPEPDFADERISMLVKEAAMLQIAAAPHVKFDLSQLDKKLTVSCDRGLISQALTNVLKNAVEAINARTESADAALESDALGRIAVTVKRENDFAIIRVIDNGIGLPKKERKTVVEPYVTTKNGGTGLGLAIVKRMVEEHGGTLTLRDVEPNEGFTTGTCVEMTLSSVAEAKQLKSQSNDPQAAVA